MTTFGQWWRSTIQTADNLTCSNSVLIYVGSDGEAGYEMGRTPLRHLGFQLGLELIGFRLLQERRILSYQVGLEFRLECARVLD